MTVLTIRRGYEALKTQDNDFFVQIQNSTHFSNLIPYYREQSGKAIVFPIISIIIHLDEGEVTEIKSEDLSPACSGG